MIELKVHGHEVELITEDGEDFPGEVVAAIHSLAGAVAKMLCGHQLRRIRGKHTENDSTNTENEKRR